jgi:hypothetical protein
MLCVLLECPLTNIPKSHRRILGGEAIGTMVDITESQSGLWIYSDPAQKIDD